MARRMVDSERFPVECNALTLRIRFTHVKWLVKSNLFNSCSGDRRASKGGAASGRNCSIGRRSRALRLQLASSRFSAALSMHPERRLDQNTV